MEAVKFNQKYWISFPLSVMKEAAVCIYSHMVEFLWSVDTAFFAVEAHGHVAHSSSRGAGVPAG